MKFSCMLKVSQVCVAIIKHACMVVFFMISTIYRL